MHVLVWHGGITALVWHGGITALVWHGGITALVWHGGITALVWHDGIAVLDLSLDCLRPFFSTAVLLIYASRFDTLAVADC